ncbi:hypothetical protein VNO77_17061 [Canavalia gladiata]|uniref:Carbonic anhydrase n=1 Tax=Canavalia gladiata TaxID=3824 RepID=A0AAN9LN66_CANGL
MTLPTNRNLFSVGLVVLVLFSSPFLSTASGSNKTENTEEFSYAVGTPKGPENWGHLNPEWKTCGIGKRQSPIDVQDNKVQVFHQLGKLKKDYKPAPAVLKNRGHDIMLQWKGEVSQLHINATYYKLIQCHWHTPSEHTLNGKKFDLELHAVHRNSKGEIAVIAILYKIGHPDYLLSKLFRKIKSLGDKDIELGVMNPGDIKFGSRKYYRYVGSLTTPPCTEGVIWTIVKKVRTVSKEQLRVLQEAVHHEFQENARPTQALKGREVWLYTPEKNHKPT